MPLSANEAARSSARAERPRAGSRPAAPNHGGGSAPALDGPSTTSRSSGNGGNLVGAGPSPRSSGSRQDLQLAVLAEVVVVGDRADDPVLARPEVHARPHDLAGVRGRRAGVLLLLVLAERAVEL